MEPVLHTVVNAVAVSIAAAAHLRDHQHEAEGNECHPHVVEVVNLGSRAVAVCHDCRADSGFLPHRAAERMALAHQQETYVSGGVMSCLGVS